MRKAILYIILAVFLLAPMATAHAHPFIDRTAPERLSSALVGTERITIWYSEAVEIEYSSLTVYDSSGNIVDNSDTAYHMDDTSLYVTTAPLTDGVYTVSSKVLSRIDGHLVSNAFVFAVGSATIDRAAAESVVQSAQVFVPEALAKLPGLVGQTLIIGAAAAMLFTWRLRGMLQDGTARPRFMMLVGVGIILALASDMLMLAAHAYSIGAHILDAVGTTFGTTIMARLGITVMLLGVWFVAERRAEMSRGWPMLFAALGLALAATSTMIGHGAASEQMSAILLDYAHNIVAALWIGGVAFVLFVMIPVLGRLKSHTDAAALATVSTFSAVFVSCVGIVAVTGPLLLWLLEDDVGAITGSTYGMLIIAKIALGAAMVAMGAYNWRIVMRKSNIISRLRCSLRIEVCLGIALLGIVALLTNTTLPAGEADNTGITRAGLDTRIFSENAAFDVSVWPLAAGPNTITVRVTDPDGSSLADLEGVGAKVYSIERSIAPIDVDMTLDGATATGELTLGFWGRWNLEIEALRSESASESVTISTLVKPQLADLGLEIREYDLPDGASPLHIAYDGNATFWLSDPAAPRIWSFERDTGEFAEHAYDGAGSVVLDIATDGRIWFTDIQSSSIGSFDPQTDSFDIIGIPELEPADTVAIPVWIDVARDGSVWISIPNKDVILELDPDTQEFLTHVPLTRGVAPFAISEDAYGDIWFTEQSGGAVGRIDRDDRTIDELAPMPALVSGETISFDDTGGLWISEHREGGGIVRLDPVSGTFERIAAPQQSALANSVSFDRHHNAWFALHTVDSLAVYDPVSHELAEIPIPTENSWVQFTVSDDNGNIWFAEQRPAKLGVVQITDPTSTSYAAPQESVITFAELAAPLMAIIVISAALLVVRAIRIRRRALAELDAARLA